MRFLNRKENVLILFPGYIIYEILITYFLYFEDSAHARSIVFASALMLVSFLTAYSVFRYKEKSVEFSANLLGVTMSFYGCFYIVRLIYLFSNPGLGSYNSQDWTTVLQYILGLVVGLMYTFGLIFMVNQKLNSDAKAAKEHFEKIFNTSPDAIILTNLKDGKILNVNEAYTKIAGYSEKESIGKTTIELGLWKGKELRDKTMKSLLFENSRQNIELEFLRKDGVAIYGLLSSSIINLNGVPHAISVVKDISGRVKAENVIRQKNEELEIANSEKDKLFSILSHDLKNAFNIFLGYTDLLATDIDKLNRDETYLMAKNMNLSAKNLYKLLENLLEWSLFKRGLTKVNPESISLFRLIEEITEQVSESASEKEIRIAKNIPYDIFVIADKPMLGIVLRNLLSNAVKFTHKGGVISITSARKGRDRVIITVSDTGIGMDKEIRENIFKPGVNIKRKGTENEQSSGLGLILVKEYVTKLGGSISVESEEGLGSSFKVELPV